MSGYTQSDYEAIEAAVLESPRGRWFLGEYARRNRAADTLMLLEAIRKLERGMAENSSHQLSDELAAELESLSETIGSMLAGDVREVTEEDGLRAVEQLSRIKQRIDKLLADRSRDEGTLTSENLAFFAGDEGLFEAAAGAAPVASPSLMVVGEAARGNPNAGGPAAQAATGAAASPSGPKADPKDRIVFIRRASSKETSIPLAEESGEPVAPGRSQPAS